jgi:hypothetical protein
MAKRGRKSVASSLVIAFDAAKTRPRLTPPSLLAKAERELFIETANLNPHLRAADAAFLAAYVQALAKTYKLARLTDAASVASWEKTSRVMMSMATKPRITSQAQTNPLTAGRARNNQQPVSITIKYGMNQMNEDDFNEVDRAALNRAIEMSLVEDDRDHVEHVREMRTNCTWWEVASYCSHHQQFKALGLRPWQDPPCYVDLDNIEPRADQHSAAQLLRRMISHRVSRYAPDPVAAIEATRTK